MADAFGKGIRIASKNKKKTNIFWSTVPENEQFRNVQVPGVDLGTSGDHKMNLKRQEQVESLRKSRSDPSVQSSHVDLSISRKITKVAGKRAEFARKNSNTVGIKGGVSSSGKDSVLDDSISSGASIKNLTIEDKKRVANLIKELAKTGEERELALETLQEERVSFEERLSAVQEEQATLRLERESLRDELKGGQELLKKYEMELEDVKRDKEKQDLILSKQSVALGTQTSPLPKISAGILPKSSTTDASLSTSSDGDSVHSTTHPPGGHPPSEIPQIPVYSNTLFDLKTSKVEQPGKHSVNTVADQRLLNGKGNVIAQGAGLHEFYLREYRLQLRLQEQQLEVQRQQVVLQQHLDKLQQQQLLQNPELRQPGEKKKEPQLLQQSGRNHKQTQFLEEENDIPYGSQGPFTQQHSGNIYPRAGMQGGSAFVHHLPPEHNTHQFQQGYREPKQHINPMKRQCESHPKEYHHQYSEQNNIPTEKHPLLTNKHHSPADQHFHMDPNTREEYFHTAPETYHSSEPYNPHHLKQNPCLRQSSYNPTDKHAVREQPFYPEGQHSPDQNTSGLRQVSNKPADVNNNVRPNPRHRNCSTYPDTDQVLNSGYVNVQVPLDQYISDYQNVTGYQSVVKPVVHARSKVADHASTTGWVEKPDAPLHPGYSLYKADIPQENHGTRQSPKRSRKQSPSPTSHVQTPRKNYPNSLIQIVEDLEGDRDLGTSSYGDVMSWPVTVTSDDEEKAVLDDVFFQKW